MQVAIEVTHLATLLKDANKQGAIQTLIELGHIKPTVNKSQAIKLCGGKSNYDQWVMQGLINPKRDGDDSAPYRIERMEIEAARTAWNKAGYVTVEERETIKKPHLGKRG